MLAKAKGFLVTSKSIWEWVKLKGAKVDPLATSIPVDRFEDMIHTLSSNALSSEMKQKVMQRAVSQCPAIPMDLLG